MNTKNNHNIGKDQET